MRDHSTRNYSKSGKRKVVRFATKSTFRADNPVKIMRTTGALRNPRLTNLHKNDRIWSG